ncbi:MAG: hypothetical protein R3Y62_05325 [Eubacteriales bacterium]
MTFGGITMTTERHFRSAINGFHRGDVVDFIETQSLLHKKEVNQLRRALDEANQKADAEHVARVDAVKQCFYELEAKNTSQAIALELCNQLEAELGNMELLEALKACLSK